MICVWNIIRRPAPSLALALVAGLRLFVASTVALSARSTAAAEALRPPRILTSFLPVFSIVRQIAGDRASVENWLPPGIDPHEFQFQPRDLRRLREADLLVIAGLGLEGWTLSQLRSAAANPRLQLLEASRDLPDSVRITATRSPGAKPDAPGSKDHEPPGHEHGTSGTNPHFWLDPVLVSYAVTNVLNALVQLDPAGREVYLLNANATLARLEALHRDFVKRLDPAKGTAFITYHDAFPYLARRYGLKLVGVVEENAAEEPSPRELAALAATVRREKARVLFVDGQPTRLARRLADDLGIKIVTIETLEIGPLSADAYDAGMRRNLATLQAALVPASP